MVTHNSDRSDADAVQDQRLSRIYQAAARTSPPPALDAKILAEARRAMTSAGKRHAFAKRWGAPLSAAAVNVLALGVALRVSQQSMVDPTAPSSVEVPAVPVPEPVQEPRLSKRTVPPARDATAERARSESADSANTAEAAGTRSGVVASTPPSELERKHTVTTARARGDEVQENRPELLAQSSAARVNANANVVSVEAAGAAGAYQFTVSVHSPDVGCEHYVDWWEVVSEDGRLLHRTVFAHSHAHHRRFTSVGAPVPIQPDTVVWVRAHMNRAGYGGIAFKGSPKTGFGAVEMPDNFASALANQPPLPAGCIH